MSDEHDDSRDIGRTTLAASPVSKRLAKLIHDESTSPEEPTPCPRCGAVAAAPRAATPKSPFRKPSVTLTCSLCGLDYPRGESPWQPGELPRTLAPFLRPSG